MVMSQKTLFTKSALAVAVAIISTQAWSAGFQLNEFSSSGLGRAYSGEGAIADDAGNASRNPALIMMFDRPTFSAGAVYIDPDVNISGKSPYTGRSTDADNIAPTAWVPNAHFVMPINEQFGWGASVTSNYGLATEFNDSYIVGEYGGKTDLKTVNLNLSSAYRLNDSWSFGLGFNAVYAGFHVVLIGYCKYLDAFLIVFLPCLLTDSHPVKLLFPRPAVFIKISFFSISYFIFYFNC